MPRLYKNGRDANDLIDGLTNQGYPVGAFITPGAAVNVNVQPGIIVSTGNGTDVDCPGATNLTVTAGGAGGQSVRNLLVADNTTGAVSAVAGTSATTGTQVAPATPAGKTVLGWVDVPNGAASVLQANIFHQAARNYL